MINVDARLEQMQQCPRMWALTKEGFTQQVVLLLEFAGVGEAAKGLLAAVQDPSASLTDDYARSAIAEAKALLSATKRPFSVNPLVCSGRPAISGTRFSLAQLFAEIAEGDSLEAIAKDFDLNAEQLQEILRYQARAYDQGFTLTGTSPAPNSGP